MKLLVYINKLDSLYKLTKIPNEIIHLLVGPIIFLILLMVIMFIAFGLILPKPKEQDLIDKLAGSFAEFYLKMVSAFINIVIMLVLMFMVMQALFKINIRIIITLYHCHINKELFKTLIGPIITVSTVSFSVLGAFWSKSPLQDIFNEIKCKIPKLFEKVQSFPEYFILMLIIILELFFICLELFF